MEAEQVVKKILSEAQQQAEEIKQQAKETLEAEQKQLTKQLQEYNEQTQELAAKAAKDTREHLLSAARMETSKQLLAEKRKILNQVFNDAKKQFKELPEAEYSKVMKKLMLESVETGDEEVIVDKNESRLNHKFIKEINRELGTGYKGNLKLSEQRQDIGAGFILKRGQIKNNVSLGVLVEQAKDELEIELAKILFSD
ncbi:V-type ATP synthase subunit E [Planctomycetota bacterium]